MTLTVPCLFGLESLVADEMRRLDLKNVQAENGRVHCEGTLADIARLNINLRCGARVLMELGSFPARDFEALFQGVYALPWEDYISRDGEFPVKGYSLNSQLHSVPACQSIVKKASAKRLGEKYGVETLPESGSRYQIQFSIIKDVATLYLDTSGEGLYKRGYRAKNMGAPLRETLAAALVLQSGCAAILFAQAALNLGGSLNVLPLTGVSFPILSSGGSSMIANFSLIGFLIGGFTYETETALQTLHVSYHGTGSSVPLRHRYRKFVATCRRNARRYVRQSVSGFRRW